MKTFTTLLFLSFCVTLSGMAQTPELKKFTGDGYEIQYSSDWTLDTSGKMNTAFILMGRAVPSISFKENLNLLIQDLSGQNLNLDSFTELSKTQMLSMPGGVVLESKRDKKNGHDYQILVSQIDVQGQKLKFKQYYWVIGTKAYVLTYTTSADTYDAFIPAADKVLSSFTMK